MNTETWRLARCDAEPRSGAPLMWHVGFDVRSDAGRPLHIVTTVYADDLDEPSRESAIERARSDLYAQHFGMKGDSA